MAPASSSPKSRKKASPRAESTPSRPRGRPRKDSEVADRLLSVRLAPADWALLEGLVEQQRAALRAAGAMAEAAERVGAADVVRGLLRQAAREKGLTP
jgi:hypothetical protein